MSWSATGESLPCEMIGMLSIKPLKETTLQIWIISYKLHIMITVNNFSVPVMYYMILENKNLF